MWLIYFFLLLILLGWAIPQFLFFVMALTTIEAYTMMLCRHRDKLLASGEWQEDEAAFRAAVAKESRFGVYRPGLSAICVFGLLIAASSAMDEYGQCFWNSECSSDLDCTLNILIPAVLACAVEVQLTTSTISIQRCSAARCE